MLKFKNIIPSMLIAALLVPLVASTSFAGLFDWFRPERAAARRGQSPETEQSGVAPSMSAAQPAGSYASPQSVAYESGLPSGWGYDSSPCFDCGSGDRCQSWTRCCRKTCGSTYYPRFAPYCQAGWGYNETCWRRMADCNRCPQAAAMTPVPQPPQPDGPAAIYESPLPKAPPEPPGSP